MIYICDSPSRLSTFISHGQPPVTHQVTAALRAKEEGANPRVELGVESELVITKEQI
jgi:hypothetical protein